MKKNRHLFQSEKIIAPDKNRAMEQSARILKDNGLIVFPTKGLYGIGARIDSEVAVKKVYELKQRDYLKPILILIKDISEVKKYCADISDKAFYLMEKFWPGNITIILKASKKTNPLLTGGTGKIGVRIPAHEFTYSLLQKLDFPITGTSANISDTPPPSDINHISEEIIKKCDIVINSGQLKTDLPSTVIDASSKNIKIIREGRIKKDIIARY